MWNLGLTQIIPSSAYFVFAWRGRWFLTLVCWNTSSVDNSNRCYCHGSSGFVLFKIIFPALESVLNRDWLGRVYCPIIMLSSINYVRYPCYGYGISCLWLLLLKPKPEGDLWCKIQIGSTCTRIGCDTNLPVFESRKSELRTAIFRQNCK